MLRGVIWSFLIVFVLTGCAGTSLEINSMERTNQLAPGMTFPEVVQILGKPKSSEFKADKWVLKYSLHQYWKGWVPFYVVFDKRTKKVVTWFVDEEEYVRNQMMWMEAMKAMQKGSGRKGGTSAPGTVDAGFVDMGDYGMMEDTADSYDPFEADSAGWPGGAYQNPDSSYYQPDIYGN